MKLSGARAPLFILLALACLPWAAKAAPVFGTVTAIGGNASDIALDESRGVLYIANFGAHTIDVMSTGTNTISTSLNVLPWPGALALSADSQYLVVAHYCNGTTTPACTNALTSIHLADSTQQVYNLASAPLGIAFLGNGTALIVTTSNFLTFNPVTGVIAPFAPIANTGQPLPVAFATFPGQILQAALSTSADGNTIWGIASAGTNNQFVFQYSGATNTIDAAIYVTSPLLLPRISTSADGSFAAIGYALVGHDGVLIGRYPDIISSTNITGVALDSVGGTVYAQYPDTNQSTGPAGHGQASMLIMDSDNLTFRDRISIPEDMVGRAVLNKAATMLYAASESGVMILPVGSLNSANRLAATTEDLLFKTNFCASGPLTQTLTIADPGGNATDFTLSTTQPGVTFVPASGTTSGKGTTVQVQVDPLVFTGSGGTATATINISSRTAVNQPKPVRLLMNNPDPSQRGAILDQPGILSDILADTARNRVYVLRQDMNQLLVYDGTSGNLIQTIRTYTSPTMMAMTSDQNFMLVAHDDSEYVGVYDLNTFQTLTPIVLPGGHYGRSIAVTGNAILALVRNEGENPGGVIDSINLAGRTAAAIPTLGVYENGAAAPVSQTGILSTSPSGANVLYAGPDGYVALYTTQAATFVTSRHDLTALSGGVAASDFGVYVAGNSVLDPSLVPSGTVSASPLSSSGFTFVAQDGYSSSTTSSATAGSLAHLQMGPNAALPLAAPLITTDAPLLPIGATFVWLGGYGTYGSGSFNAHGLTSFSRTVAPLPNSGSIFMLSTSGLSVLNTVYPAQPTPAISAVVSAADGSQSVAPGELVSIYGQNMSSVSMAASSVPLTTGLGNSCIAVNGSPMPLLYVSPQQINAQLPFTDVGSTTLTIHSPLGLSNNFTFNIQPAAPSVFTGTVGGVTQVLVVRDDDGQLVTPTNPLHPKDIITIFLTGMGQTSPAVAAGQVSPTKPLASALLTPAVTLGTLGVPVSYAGLAPGEIGVYQINATVPSGVTGLSVPLAISQGGVTTTLNLRVVN